MKIEFELPERAEYACRALLEDAGVEPVDDDVVSLHAQAVFKQYLGREFQKLLQAESVIEEADESEDE